MNNVIKHSASILATAFVLVFIGAAVANAGPCGAPGTCNAPAPLNVGLNQQTKLGSLYLNGSTSALSTALVVMFGTSTFNGHVQITDGTQGAGKILTSDANGVASWQTSSSSASSTIIYNYKTTCRASIVTSNAGWNYHDFTAGECDGGLPVTGCIGAMSSMRNQTQDTHMAVMSPGESGPASGTSMNNATYRVYPVGGFATYRSGTVTTASASTVARYFCPTAVSSVATGGGSANVSGTKNYVSKFGTPSSLVNSQIFDSGTAVGIGTAVPTAKLEVAGAGDSTVELKVNGRIQSAGASGGMWVSAAADSTGRFVGSNGTDVGLYNTGWRFTVSPAGQVKIPYGSPTAGKVLTAADSTGLATWGSPIGSITGTVTWTEHFKNNSEGARITCQGATGVGFCTANNGSGSPYFGCNDGRYMMNYVANTVAIGEWMAVAHKGYCVLPPQ